MSEEKEAVEEFEEGSSGLGNIVAKSEEAIMVAEMEEDNNNDDFVPSFFIEEDDRCKIELDLLFNKSTGRVLSVSRAGLVDLSGFKKLHLSKEWFEFSIPTYDEISRYRQHSMVIRNGQTLIDAIKLRNYLLVWCLKDWSLKNKDGSKQELQFNDNGALSDESISKVYSLPSSIIDVVLSILEKDVLLTD